MAAAEAKLAWAGSKTAPDRVARKAKAACEAERQGHAAQCPLRVETGRPIGPPV